MEISEGTPIDNNLLNSNQKVIRSHNVSHNFSTVSSNHVNRRQLRLHASSIATNDRWEVAMKKISLSISLILLAVFSYFILGCGFSQPVMVPGTSLVLFPKTPGYEYEDAKKAKFVEDEEKSDQVLYQKHFEPSRR